MNFQPVFRAVFAPSKLKSLSHFLFQNVSSLQSLAKSLLVLARDARSRFGNMGSRTSTTSSSGRSTISGIVDEIFQQRRLWTVAMSYVIRFEMVVYTQDMLDRHRSNIA